MKTMIKNNNLNSLSKIAFLMNIPLVLLYLPICFIYSDTQGVLLQGINFILCVVLFAFYFVTLLFIGNNKKIIVSNLLIQTVLANSNYLLYCPLCLSNYSGCGLFCTTES